MSMRKQLKKQSLRIWKGMSPVLIWLTYDFTCIRLIFAMIWPQKRSSKSKPSSFLIWFAGVYFTLYAIADARYVFVSNAIQNRADSLLNLYATDLRLKALERIAPVQHSSCPYMPIITQPKTVFDSLFKHGGTSWEASKKLSDFLSDFLQQSKGQFNMKLTLSGTVLMRASLPNANLNSIIFEDAIFDGADLHKADFSYAKLKNVDFTNALLTRTVFVGADLTNANFTGADLGEANLVNAKGVTATQLLRASSIKGIKVNDNLKKELSALGRT